ncbi:unnamed protein product [Euphydryas editha]|uniref:Uncharacterized protein n=1 Tax=Euphydryas editha TaxID=104508 RepID=A0AAU9UX24_EUPED|nr:unnamed protein product [Euphydryas editha]
MILRIFTKQRLLILFITLIMFVSVIYFYLNYVQENYNNAQLSNDRCFTELKSAKYQLNVVTEYKNRIDKLLTETEKQHKLDKERFRDIMESCVAMKQQSMLCQSQFEDLQMECKKAKEDLDKIRQDLPKKVK